MRTFFQLAVLAAAAVRLSLATPVPVPVQTAHPQGGAKGVIITDKNTLNGTNTPNATTTTVHPNIKATEQLPFTFVNNYSGNVNAYVTGLDPNNKVVMLQPNGAFYYPTVSSGQTTPQPINANVALPVSGGGGKLDITLPNYISAARVYFAIGELQFFVVADGNGNPAIVQPAAVNPNDPNANVNWGFVELTNNDSGIYANISYVDFVGLLLGMTLTNGDGSTQNVPGLEPGSVTNICNSLNGKASDGQPWDQLCMVNSAGSPIRVLSPNDYVSVNGQAFSSYYNSYVSQVWSHYTNTPLVIDTQESYGQVSCQVSGSTLNCAGDNRGYAMPSVADIWGCNSGPFAIEASDNDVHRAVVPRLCAAFDRTTLLLSGGNVQPSLPPSSYYTTEPTNWYSSIVHQNEIDGIGYAFSYDDVGPSNAPSQSGLVSDSNPQRLTITVNNQ